jgi:hypothetical protein
MDPEIKQALIALINSLAKLVDAATKQVEKEP